MIYFLNIDWSAHEIPRLMLTTGPTKDQQLETGDAARIRTMSHTIYAAKFEQTIIHQHVHLRRESQSHEPAHVLMRLYSIDKSLVCYLFLKY
jgi:calcineurin-like phosphoesterase family protein